MKLTAVIITFNEEDNIDACLESVAWCDEVVVVDSNSTDGTERICRARDVVFQQREWPGINDQRQYAMEQASHDWILAVDADERVSPELREEISVALANGSDLFCGYAVPRHTFYLGRWIDHGGWYPDLKLRLFDRRKAQYTGVDPHDRVTVEGPVMELTGELHHHTYRDLSHQLATIDSFSTTRARRMHQEGRTFSLFSLLFRPPVKFLETYVWKKGFLDGLAGLVIAVSTAYYIFLTWSKLWEMNHE